MKKTLALLAVFFAAFLCYGQDPILMNPTSEQGKAMGAKEVNGTVHEIDLQKKIITVKDEITGVVTKYSFSDATSFLKEEGKIQAAKVKSGDKVSLKVDSQNSALSIRIESKDPVQKGDTASETRQNQEPE